MSKLMNQVKQLELIRTYSSQDETIDFAEYNVLDNLRKDILKRVDRDPTLPVMLQERTFVLDGEEQYKVYVFVIEGDRKDKVFIGTQSPDEKFVNRELWNWVLGRAD